MMDATLTVNEAEGVLGAPMPPGPKGWPLLGEIPAIRRAPLDYFAGLSQRFGPVVSYAIGRDRITMVNAPDLVKHVMQDNADNYRKSKFYRPLAPVLGRGIFLAEGRPWVNQRRKLVSGFKGPRFPDMAKQVVDAADDMLARWEETCRSGDVIDMSSEMMHIALDGVARALFNIRVGGEHGAIYNGLTVTLSDAERRVWSPLNLPRWVPTKSNRAYKDALVQLDRITRQIINDRRRADNPPEDLLTTLIETYEGEDDSLLRDEVLSILLSGHETTANALAWVWTVLAAHPDIEARVVEEAERVLGGRLPTWEDLPKLDYISRVFEETLRLYPPVWTLSREALADDVVGGYRVKGGTTVQICPYAMHRNPDLWPDPERFDPDRFLPEEVEKRDRYAYIPFGGGPRVCLGKRFAMMEAPFLIAMVVQRYKMIPATDAPVEPEPMITLRPKGGVPVRLQRRA